MLSILQKINNNNEKQSEWTYRFNSVKAALFNNSDDVDFEFTNAIMRENTNGDETSNVDALYTQEFNNDEIQKEAEAEQRTGFLNNRVKDQMLSSWEMQGEDGPSSDFTTGITTEEAETFEPVEKPLVIGFDAKSDYLELEYMVTADPKTGHFVEPVIHIEPSFDGTSGDVYLNDKLVVSVAGINELNLSDIKLVMIEA